MSCFVRAGMRISHLVLMASLAGCGGSDPAHTSDDPFSSARATLYDFEFDGSLTTSSSANNTGTIRAQLMYTLGQINGEPGVSRLSKLTLTNVSGAWSGSLYTIKYHAKLPVAWGDKNNGPSSYTFILPKRVDSTGQSAFTTKYGPTCNDGEPDSVDVANYWYHYRPQADGCNLAPADIVSLPAKVTRSTLNTDGKYPEYQKVWEDGSLRVVALFAKYAVGDTGNDDAGIDAYNRFVQAVAAELPGARTTPATVNSVPGVAQPDITFQTDTVEVVAMLVDGVPNMTTAQNTRYAQLTPGADVILYNGHAGLGANVAALSKKGYFFPDTYQIVFMNGCDTFAYIDNTLATTRAALNPSDPTGTKFMDTIANAMPAYFNSMPDASMALIRALENQADPQSYDQIFAGIDPSQVVVVTGEEDNVFTPSFEPSSTWNGFHATGTVGYKQVINYQTEQLSPGTYAFTMVPDWAHSGGDGDLRIQIGSKTAVATKCPSYKYDSDERCLLKLSAPAVLYLSGTGDSSAQAAYVIDGWQE
jgi:hypothetical protein